MPYVKFIMGNKISPEKADKLKTGAAEIMERHTGKVIRSLGIGKM